MWTASLEAMISHGVMYCSDDNYFAWHDDSRTAVRSDSSSVSLLKLEEEKSPSEKTITADC